MEVFEVVFEGSGYEGVVEGGGVVVLGSKGVGCVIGVLLVVDAVSCGDVDSLVTVELDVVVG